MHLMQQTMRWFGPADPVPLSHIRQAGCSGVVTALHQFAPGELWPVEAIEERRRMIEAAGMSWTVIESLPVSEDIKKRSGDYERHIENYRQSIRNVAACGLKVITYNFMPVLDWLRTDVSYPMPDGSRALYFERAAFVAFDLFLLKRPGAAAAYAAAEQEQAAAWLAAAGDEQKEALFRNALLALPGTNEDFTPEQVLQALDSYRTIDAAGLKENLVAFLQQVVPVAEACGVVLAIHPDDPPYPVLGLPRVMSTAQDVADMAAAVPSTANGLCFCTGSFGARADNDLPDMIRRFGDRIHFLHLRNTRRDAAGNFYEADHLAGDADMAAIIREVLLLQQRRGVSLPMRPDHGHQMLDDLNKQTYPGYSAIGRLRGLAELRGVEYALSKTGMPAS
ncbi:MAG TPA: mannonate dehydratase [Lacibacter sp.]|nr:mannonate dehydratase [Lacibacter sp.]HMO89214.1 mannonate dehydratase [Lacibacter sp.]HMP86404.1 mannonate dehydratase [Lacibacter sp.]